MNISRRKFATIGLGTAAALAAGRFARGQLPVRPPEHPVPNDFPNQDGPGPEAFFKWKALSVTDRVCFGQGGNALLSCVSHGAILVDTKLPGLGDTLNREGAAFGWPINMVILTHHHRDHVGGTSTFIKKKASTIAHRNCPTRVLFQAEGMMASAQNKLKELEAADPPVPAQVIEEVRAFVESAAEIRPQDFTARSTVREKKQVVGMNELAVELHNFGPGHTDNDLVVFLPARNILHTGDLLFNRIHPVIDLVGGANTRGWQERLKEIQELCSDGTTIIPGHGELTTRAALQEQYDYFDRLRAIVEKAHGEGKPREEIIAIEVPEYAAYQRPQGLGLALGAIYDEMYNPPPPFKYPEGRPVPGSPKGDDAGDKKQKPEAGGGAPEQPTTPPKP